MSSDSPIDDTQIPLDQLLDGAREGDSEARQELNSRLRDDPAARDTLAEILATESAILDHFEDSDLDLQIPGLLNSGRKLHRRSFALIAASVMALVALIAILLPDEGEDSGTFATLTNAGSGIHLDSGTLLIEGSRIGKSRFALHEGEVGQLAYDNGTQLTLKGPLELDIESPLHSLLHDGTVTAHVPESATGFTIVGPGFKVVDLGTAFTMEVRENNGWVDVLEGVVEVSANTGEPTKLLKGHSAHLTRSSVTLQKPGQRFVQNPPAGSHLTKPQLELPQSYHTTVAESAPLLTEADPGSTIAFSSPGDALTLEFWFYQENGDGGPLFTLSNNKGNLLRLALRKKDRHLQLEGYLPDKTVSKTSHHPYDPSSWNHVVAVCRGDTLRMFLNGKYEGSHPIEEALDLNKGLQLNFSRKPETNIAFLAIYPKALEGTQVRTHSRASKEGK